MTVGNGYFVATCGKPVASYWRGPYPLAVYLDLSTRRLGLYGYAGGCEYKVSGYRNSNQCER